ncbi:MAG: CopG family transcriptional regulator [Actinobacteria bacterium]|nr:CopG family transcriptional regulator [Actinomycetota bacterium]
MATKKITITLPEEQLDLVRDLVAHGQAASISSFVQQAVDASLHDSNAWALELARGLEETGGPLTAAEIAWADEILGIGSSNSTARS